MRVVLRRSRTVRAALHLRPDWQLRRRYLKLWTQGDHVIASDDMYGGTFRLFERVRKRSAGLTFTYVDMGDPERIREAATSRTKLIWIETPSNPMLKLIDLDRVAEIGKAIGAVTVADNTFASPYLQRPH